MTSTARHFRAEAGHEQGAFRVVSSADADSRAARGVDKVVALVRVVPGALALAVEELRRLAAESATGAGWTVFARDPATRGGRFDAVLEIDARTSESSRVIRDALASQLAVAPQRIESTVLAMCDRLALP